MLPAPATAAAPVAATPKIFPDAYGFVVSVNKNSPPTRKAHSTTAAAATAAKAEPDPAGLAKDQQLLQDERKRQLGQWQQYLALNTRIVKGQVDSKLKALVRQGIPPQLRGNLWQILSGSKELQAKSPPSYYKNVRVCFSFLSSL